MLYPRSSLALAAAAALALSLGGCGELSALDDSGESGGSSVPAEVEAAFAGSCATPGCHDASTRAGQLSLEGADLDALVGKPSGGSDLPLVEIGSVQGSYLAIKMLPDDVVSANGLERSGGRMPPTGDFTNPNNATILAWIAGAEFPDDSGGSDSDSEGSSGSGDGMVTFNDDILPTLPTNCSCHNTDAGTGGLSLVEASAYMNLVGVASPTVPALNLIEPNEPENSYVMNKLNGTHEDVGGFGGRMPSEAGLDDSAIQLWEDWILAGAPE